MVSLIELPTVHYTIGGNQLALTVGGVKAYNLDSIQQKKGVDEHFKVFIGFQNKICTNMCVCSDGYIADLRVKSVDQLTSTIIDLIERHVEVLAELTDYYLTESEFAQLIGRCRLYQFLPTASKQGIPPLLLGDQQISTVARDYYRDSSFCKEDNGCINL